MALEQYSETPINKWGLGMKKHPDCTHFHLGYCDHYDDSCYAKENPVCPHNIVPTGILWAIVIIVIVITIKGVIFIN